MVIAWLLTLPGAGLIGGAASLLAERGTWGVLVLLVLLAAGSGVIWQLSRRHHVGHHNVTDRHEVLVLNSASAKALRRAGRHRTESKEPVR